MFSNSLQMEYQNVCGIANKLEGTEMNEVV
jgi:hypothetical protein